MEALDHGDPGSIGGYRLLARIGAGGMATVYFGQSTGGRAVAVKVMHADLAADPDFRARFQQEVDATRAVGGGFGAPFVDAGPQDPRPWLVTEFLPAVSLLEAVRTTGALPTGPVWPLAAGIVEALRAIHRVGVVHLDLNPSNVLLTADGVRVIDFGLARPLHAAAPGAGAQAGTRQFMSPEQQAGAAAAPASDVFSLGMTLLYACVGDGPFRDRTAGLEGVGDDALRAMIAGCVAPDPAARPDVARLTEQLAAATRDGGPAGTAWLPAPVAAEIDQRGSRAANPPPRPPRPDRVGRVGRRAVLFGALGAVVLAGGVGAVVAVAQSGDTEPSAAPHPSPKSPSPSPSPTPPPRVLEFHFTGKVTLTSLTYTVNGAATTLHKVKLPWSKSITVAPLPDRADWRLAFDYTPGTVDYRVLVDGFQVAVGEYANTDPGHGSAKGSH